VWERLGTQFPYLSRMGNAVPTLLIFSCENTVLTALSPRCFLTNVQIHVMLVNLSSSSESMLLAAQAPPAPPPTNVASTASVVPAPTASQFRRELRGYAGG